MRIIRKFEEFSKLLKPVLTEVESFTKSLENGTFTYDTPRTALRGVVARLAGAFNHADLAEFRKLEPEMEQLIKGFFRLLARPSVIARMRRSLREDKGRLVDVASEELSPSSEEEKVSAAQEARLRAALTYLNELHRHLPYATLAIIAKLPIWTPNFIWDVCRLIHLQREARAATGERRAHALEALARHVTEYIHQRYVQALGFSELLVKGTKPPKRQASYGAIVKDLVGQGSRLQGLIHPDAAILRNAASHADRWHVDDETWTITIRDGHGVTERAG